VPARLKLMKLTPRQLTRLSAYPDKLFFAVEHFIAHSISLLTPVAVCHGQIGEYPL